MHNLPAKAILSVIPAKQKSKIWVPDQAQGDGAVSRIRAKIVAITIWEGGLPVVLFAETGKVLY
jgi:hypothetical protein